MTETLENIDALEAEFLTGLAHQSNIVRQIPCGAIRRRPMFGGVFGSSGYGMGSLLNDVGGLHEVSYFIYETGSNFVLGTGTTKVAAIESARTALSFVPQIRLSVCVANFRKQCETEKAQRQELEKIEFSEKRKKAQAALQVKKIPKRRRKIFDDAGGKCHYCSAELNLFGRWHVDHKMPKALGGGNEPGNLVASCAPCNHAKRDTTDQEFAAKIEKAASRMNMRVAA